MRNFKFDKKQIQCLNRKAKVFEKHHEIAINHNDEKVECVFERFIGFENEVVTFSIISNDRHRFVMVHDYNSGITVYKDGSQAVEIEGLFSKRHLRSFLLFVWDMYRKLVSDGKDELTETIHRKCPVPILKTETNTRKKHWFKVDNITLTNKAIVMDGILSTTISDYISNPIKAGCVYNINKGTVAWKYKQNGKLVKEDCEEKVEFNSPFKPEAVFHASAMIYKQNILEGNCDYLSPYTLPILKALKNFTFRMLSVNYEGFGSKDLVKFNICGVNSVSDETIEFLICDGERPFTQLWYDRKSKKIHIYRKMQYNMRCSKNCYVFIHPKDGCEKKFNAIIKLIEKGL